MPKVPDCTQSFPPSKLPLDISADALCCAHDRGAMGHTKGAGGSQATGSKEMESPTGAALLSGTGIFVNLHKG